jgi:hypothetical protein
MNMRVVVTDTASVLTLAERLTAALGSARISVSSDSREVDIEVEPESDRGVLHVLDAVERWYDQAEIGSVEMWLGERSYTFARWMPAETCP